VLLATAEDAGWAVDMFSGYMWQTRVLEVRLDRMVGEGGAVGCEQQLGQQQQQLGGQQQYGGMGQMVQQMLSPSMGMPQLGLSGAYAYAKHNLGLGSLSGPGSPSVGGSSASMSGSGSVSASGSRPSLTGGSGNEMVDDDGARRSPMPFIVFCVSAARARARPGTGTNAGYDPKQEFVRRECESTRFKFSTVGVYRTHSYTIKVLPVIPFPFLF